MPARAADKLYHRVNYLFAETLMGGLDSDRPWKAVSTLRRMGSAMIFVSRATSESLGTLAVAIKKQSPGSPDP